MQLRLPFFLTSLVLGVGSALATSSLQAQDTFPPPVLMPAGGADSSYGSAVEFDPSAASSNPMLWQQYQALQMGVTADEGCSCNGAGSYDRCGCNTELFPWTSGPGTCDQWCVGPKWGVEASGLMMFRDDADWNRVITDVGGATTAINQFDHGPGGRVFVTGYNSSGYGIQVGYEGINDWNASLEFAPVAGATREFDYNSRLNSVEINFLPNVPSVWKVFSGFRYVQFDEDFIDTTRADRVLPAPATPAATTQAIDLGINRLLTNRMFGLQLGGRRDAWQFGNRVTLQTYANGGVYCNKFRRDDVNLTVTTTISGDDTATGNVTELTESSSTLRTSTRNDLADIAFVGEAGVVGSWRLNYCTVLRAGYQILALDGVGQGLEASFTPGLSSDTIVFHGLQFGVEYRR